MMVTIQTMKIINKTGIYISNEVEPVIEFKYTHIYFSL